jgi:hypothetical protein
MLNVIIVSIRKKLAAIGCNGLSGLIKYKCLKNARMEGDSI